MKYFVLKPEGRNRYAQASRDAMLKYADTIFSKNPVFAGEIRQWVHNIELRLNL